MAKNDKSSDTPEVGEELGAQVLAAGEVSEAEGVPLVECDVLVKRDIACVIAATVYRHELPVLAAAHGPDHIEVTAQRDIVVQGFNLVAEFDRLRRKYNDTNRDPVKEALPLGLRSLEELTGVRASPHEQRVEALVKTPKLPKVRKAAE